MKTLSFIAGLLLMTFLFSCSSSNQLASSFGKRKYMKGHFSDPIASVKTKYRPTVNIVAEPAPVHYANKMELPKVSDLLLSVASPKMLITALTKPMMALRKKQAVVKTQKSIPASASSKGNVTTMAVANADESITTYHHGGEGSASDHHYGRTAIYWFLFALLCMLLVVGLGPDSPVWGELILFAGIGFLVAIIYFIVWIVSLGADNS
jgi:hypothetical protein